MSNKYTAEPRDYEQKDWLYEQYWGEMKSCSEIAEDCGVSHDTINYNMEELGIPKRYDGWKTQKDEYDPRDEWDLGNSVQDDAEKKWVDL